LPLSTAKSTYFIAAGEHSGDLLGADLVLALRERMPAVMPFGVVGAAMARARVEAVAETTALSVMGITEVLKKLASLRMLEARLLAWIDQLQPSFAVLIDNPGFNMRLGEQLRLRGVPVYQYVAPKVWAWGESRVEQLRSNFAMVLGILPFEEEFFKSRGVNYTYVGSPLKDRIDKVIIKREAIGLPSHRTVVACLPGSRDNEIAMNLPTLIGVRALVAQTLPDALFIVPVSPNIEMETIAKTLRATSGHILSPRPLSAGSDMKIESWVGGGLHFVRGMSLEIMATADVALVASGTATLECALIGTPLVVVYTTSELTYQIAKRVVKVPYASLVNLMAGAPLVREFLQEFTYAEVAAEILSLLQDRGRNLAMRQRFEEMREQLKGKAAATAAGIIASAHPKLANASLAPVSGVGGL